MTTNSNQIDAANAPMLSVTDLHKSFGGNKAIDGASLDIEEGAITGLIGPNGAGKTTLFNLISGFIAPDSGNVRFKGRSITDVSPEQRAKRGLVRTFQITRELKGMTVMENMQLAGVDNPGEKISSAIFRPGLVRDVEEQTYEKAKELLEFINLWKLQDEYAGNLSGGQRKLLELGRPLMMNPELLMLDEPAAGVNPALTKKLLRRINELNEQGMTFVIVEHDMDVIMEISDTIIVLHNGRVLSQGPPEEIQQNEKVLEAYLGGV